MSYLRKVADNLHTATDELTQYIVNKKAELKDLNLGVEAWVPCAGAEFGYAKDLSSGWRLCMRSNDEVRALVDSPRKFRIEAVLSMHDLMCELEAQATNLTLSINKTLFVMRITT